MSDSLKRLNEEGGDARKLPNEANLLEAADFKNLISNSHGFGGHRPPIQRDGPILHLLETIANAPVAQKLRNEAKTEHARAHFGFRPSDFFRPSGFGIRTST